MKEKTDKLLTLVMLGVALLATVFAVLFAIGNGSADSLEGLTNPGTFDVAYIILMCLVIAAIVGILVFLVVKLVNRFMSNGKYWVKFLTVTVICVAVVVVSYLLSSGSDVPAEFLAKNETSEGVSKLIGAACIMVYILAAGSVISILFTEIAKPFKKK